MYWNEFIKLGKKIETVDRGEVISTIEFIEVFANKLSIRQSEFYEAQKVGLRPEIAFAVRNEQYDNHSVVKYNGKDYEIVRTYENPKNETFELYLSTYTGEML